MFGTEFFRGSHATHLRLLGRRIGAAAAGAAASCYTPSLLLTHVGAGRQDPWGPLLRLLVLDNHDESTRCKTALWASAQQILRVSKVLFLHYLTGK